MSKKYRVIIAAIGVLLGLFMAWYFFDILVFIIIAGVISLIGHPIVDLFNRIRVGKFQMPTWISALMALVIIIAIIVGFFLAFVPLITRQAEMIAKINVDEVVAYFAGVINDVQGFLMSHKIIQTNQTLQEILDRQINNMINVTDISRFFEKMISATPTVFLGVFSILFLSFFFLRDRQLLRSGILLFTPDKFQDEVKNILHKTKVMLSRYLIGLITELLTLMVLLTIGLSLVGVENTLLIGFIGGLMHVIPYLGPIIGAVIGAVLGVTGALGMGMYETALHTALWIIIISSIVTLIDNLVLQPLIYSKSVNAHPIEIFIVILMAGSLAGIPGMMLAIPGYTVLRIAAKEFLSGFKLIDKLTENI